MAYKSCKLSHTIPAASLVAVFVCSLNIELQHFRHSAWLISNYRTPYLEPLELECEECVGVVLGLELVREVLDPLL